MLGMLKRARQYLIGFVRPEPVVRLMYTVVFIQHDDGPCSYWLLEWPDVACMVPVRDDAWAFRLLRQSAVSFLQHELVNGRGVPPRKSRVETAVIDSRNVVGPLRIELV